MMSDDSKSDFEIDEDFLNDAFGERDEQGTGFANQTGSRKDFELSSIAHIVSSESSAKTKDKNVSLPIDILHSNTTNGRNQFPTFTATAYRDKSEASLNTVSVSSGKCSSALLVPRELSDAEFPSTTPRAIPKKTPLRRRKFPGPAGLLPDKISDRTLNSSFFNDSKPEASPTEEDLCSQNSASEINNSPWLQLVNDFDLNESSRLNIYNVKWIKRRASAKLLVGRKVPFLAIVIKSVDFYSTDPSVVLQDKTGEISGTLHRDFLEKYPSHLKPGTVLVLHWLGVVSTGFPVKRHYLNITLNNLISIYDLDDETESGQVRVTVAKNISIAEIVEDIEKSESQNQDISTLKDKTNVQQTIPRLFSGPSTSVNFGSKANSTPTASHRSTFSESLGQLNRFEPPGNANCSPLPNSSRNLAAQKVVPASKGVVDRSTYPPAQPRELGPKVARFSEMSAETKVVPSGLGENSSRSSADAEIVDSIFQGFDCSSLFEDF